MDDLLVDARSGVLTSLELHIRSDMPTGWVGWAARVADTRNFGGSGSLFRADPYGFGASIRDDAAARGAATGEAVERYCGNVVPEDLWSAAVHQRWNWPAHGSSIPLNLRCTARISTAFPDSPLFPSPLI